MYRGEQSHAGTSHLISYNISMANIRAFIAIEIPIELQKQLDQLINRLKKQITLRIVRWVPAGNIHVTLKFLGEVAPIQLESLSQLLINQAGKYSAFNLSVGGLGAFPSVAKPRVLWVGIQAPPTLAILQKEIENESLQLGFPLEDRGFSPHLTLARINQNASFEEIRSVGNSLTASVNSPTNQSLGSFLVGQIHIFRSDLQPGGAVYTRIGSAPLTGPGHVENRNLPGEA